MLDLNELHTAVLVLDHGSFRKAAASLGVRPSVVGRRVQSLEDAIGVSLFQRRSQGAVTTVAGERLLSRGRAILRDADLLVRTAERSGSGAEGRLCIGVVASIAGGHARELLKTFRADHPGVDLQIVEGGPGEHLARVRSLAMDVVLVVGTAPIAGLEMQPLWREPVHVALPTDHPLAGLAMIRWDQLADAHFIVTKMEPGPEIQDFVIRHLAEIGRRPVVEPRAVLREGLLALVGLGLGVSLVGTAETAVAYPDVVFRPLAQEMLSFSAVWARNNDNPPLRRFLSLARTQTQVKPRAPPVLAARAAPSRKPDRRP